MNVQEFQTTDEKPNINNEFCRAEKGGNDLIKKKKNTSPFLLTQFDVADFEFEYIFR